MRKGSRKAKGGLPVFHKDRYSKKKETTAARLASRIILAHFACFRYLQVDADRQEIWIIGQLDGDTRNAFSTTANRKPEAESRAIYTASGGVAGYAKQHREASAISTKG